MSNPKDLLGQQRVPLWLIPGPALIHQALAHRNGAVKYGPFNWRENGVHVSIYTSAAMRHLLDYIDGEDRAVDSRVHHLAHAAACCNILLDCTELGNLIDDRPLPAPTAGLSERARHFITTGQWA